MPRVEGFRVGAMLCRYVRRACGMVWFMCCVAMVMPPSPLVVFGARETAILLVKLV